MVSSSSETLRNLISGDLRIAAAFWALGRLSPSLIPSIAADSIEAGSNSPHVLRLASLEPSLDPISDVLATLLDDLNLTIPSQNEAAVLAVDRIVDGILDRRIDPVSAARLISEISLVLPVHEHAYDPYIYAASEIDDRPDESDLFVRMILDEASRWRKSRAG